MQKSIPNKNTAHTFTYLLLYYEDVGARSGHLIAGGRPASPDQQTVRKLNDLHCVNGS